MSGRTSGRWKAEISAETSQTTRARRTSGKTIGLVRSSERSSVTTMRSGPEVMVEKETGILKFTGYGEVSVHRQYVDRFIRNLWFRAFMAVVVLINGVQVVIDADFYAQCKYHGNQAACDADWLSHLNWIYLLCYFVELSLKTYAYHKMTFCNPWNVFDIFILVVGVASQVLKSVSSVAGILRLMGLARLLKVSRLVKLPRELNIMFQGFFSAFTAISFGFFVVGVMLVFWAVVGVVLVAPVGRTGAVTDFYNSWSCDFCANAFTSIWDSVVTLFGLLMFGDGFASIVFPMLLESPFTILYFAGAIFTVVHGMVNLILAVIVDKAQQIDVEETRKKAMELQAQHEEALNKFLDAFIEMDANHNGLISADELRIGYDSIPDIKDLMELNNIRRHDIDVIFDIVNPEKKEAIPAETFAEELMKVKDGNLNILMAQVNQLVKDVHTELAIVKQAVLKQAVSNRELASSPGSNIIKTESMHSMGSASTRSIQEHASMPTDMEIDIPYVVDVSQMHHNLRQDLQAQAEQMCDSIERHMKSLKESQVSGARLAESLRRAFARPSRKVVFLGDCNLEEQQANEQVGSNGQECVDTVRRPPGTRVDIEGMALPIPTLNLDTNFDKSSRDARIHPVGLEPASNPLLPVARVDTIDSDNSTCTVFQFNL